MQIIGSRAALCAALSLIALGCSDPKSEPNTPGSPAKDMSSPTPDMRQPAVDMRKDMSQRDQGPDADMAPVATWQRVYTDTSTWPAPQGHQWARSIVHLHSTHSHDACDGMPRLEDNAYNLPCLESLRAALCETRIDVAWLTDHPTHMTEVPFEDALLHVSASGDVLLRDAAQTPIANQITCPSGHKVMVRAGTEDDLMPLGLNGHVSQDPAERSRVHRSRTQEDAQTLRDAGALLWQAHSEERTLEVLREVRLDGMEIYQLHANIDPRLRRDWLGLDPTAPVVALAPFLRARNTMHPDLAFLVFLEDNTPSLNKWAALLQERAIVGTAGTDSHENVFKQITTDGERLDSYRRMISWFSNYVLIEGERTPASAQAALKAGRAFIGFDVLGDAGGFEAWMEVDGTRHELGASVDGGESATLHFNVPALVGPEGQAAELSWRVLRASGESWEEVKTGDMAGQQTLVLEGAGAYRVEVRTSAEHLRALMTGFESYASRSFPWIVTNAFRWKLPEQDG